MVSGDLNMNMQELNKASRDGDLFCEMLLGLVPSSSRATSFRSTRNARTIDWVFTNVNQKHV